MIKRQYYTHIDNAFEEYLVTKCPIMNNIYIGSMECEHCKYFHSHNYKNWDDYHVMCKHN